MRGIVNIIIGLVFVVGGMSGKMVFRGTGSGGLLAVVGLGLMGLGIYRISQASAANNAQLPSDNNAAWPPAPPANPAQNDALKPPEGQ